MSAMWIFIEIFVIVLQSTLMFYFALKAFPTKQGPTKQLLFLVPFFAVDVAFQTMHTLCGLFKPFPNFIFSYAVLVVYSAFFLSGSLSSKIFWITTFFALVSSILISIQYYALHLTNISLETLIGQTTERIILLIIANIALITMTFLLIRIIKKSFVSQNIFVLLVSIALMAANILVLINLMDLMPLIENNVKATTSLVVSSVALLTVTLLVLWLFQYIQAQNEQVLLLNAEKQRVEMQAAFLKESAQKEDEWKTWRHDMRSRFQALMAYSEHKQFDKLESYLQTIVAKFDHLPMQQSSGNQIVDIIIARYHSRAIKQQTHFEVDMVLPAELMIDDDDLLTLMDNLLENAFDACEFLQDPKERYVQVNGAIHKGHFFFTVANAKTQTTKKKGAFAMTSKTDGKYHGIGLHTIGNIVKKYSGFMEIEEDDFQYKTSILFPIQTIKKGM